MFCEINLIYFKMNKKESFLEFIRDQFEETPREQLDFDVNFKELDEYDSMVALCIIAMIDQNYGLKVGGNEIGGATTIEDLYSLISKV